jgi:hypothetical protein
VESLSETQYTLRANKHRMFLEKQNKKSLDPNYTKRKVLKNRVDTVPWGFNPFNIKASKSIIKLI